MAYEDYFGYPDFYNEQDWEYCGNNKHTKRSYSRYRFIKPPRYSEAVIDVVIAETEKSYLVNLRFLGLLYLEMWMPKRIIKSNSTIKVNDRNINIEFQSWFYNYFALMSSVKYIESNCQDNIILI